MRLFATGPFKPPIRSTRDSGQLSAIGAGYDYRVFWGGNWPAVRLNFWPTFRPLHCVPNWGFHHWRCAVAQAGRYWEYTAEGCPSKEWPWLGVRAWFTF